MLMDLFVLEVDFNMFFLTIKSVEEEERSKQLAEGDWVSVSVEMERWNLLIYQLDDLVALLCFIINLPRQVRDGNGKLEAEKIHAGPSPKISVLGKTRSLEMIVHSIRALLRLV